MNRPMAGMHDDTRYWSHFQCYSPLVPWSINSARNENVEAPGWQGAPSEEYRVYVSEAQRSQPGCIGVLIGQYLWTAVLVPIQARLG